jgi:cytochrome o ubiquinol oxidase operon protein cyoD
MLKSYLIGFVSSIILTVVAYGVVVDPERLHAGGIVLGVILTLAMVQLIIQLLCFLHVGTESAEQWKLPLVIATFAFVFLIVIASLWIMNHLNYNMTPADINQYLKDSQGGF